MSFCAVPQGLPEAAGAPRPVFPALLPDAPQHLPQTVFFIREVDELPRGDILGLFAAFGARALVRQILKGIDF